MTNLPATLTPNGTIQNIPDILTLGDRKFKLVIYNKAINVLSEYEI